MDTEDEGKQFVGTILLRFQHTISHDSRRQPAEEEEEEEKERVDGEETHITTTVSVN